MAKVDAKELEKMNMTKLSGASLRQKIADMLTSSSQCKAIFKCVNQDTGKYRIILQGIIETSTN